MSKWNTILLKDACAKIGSGATPRGGKEAYKGGATTLIRSQNIYNEGFHRDGLVHIDNQQAAELDNVEIRPGDILLNITGDSVARCCQVAADVLPARVNQHVAIIRPRHDELDARFLRYVLVSTPFQSHLLSLASAGATRNAITKAMIERLEVPVPPLPEQKRIAHILGTLDDKIELNRRMNATLEAMARALFKSWFFDFDPVRWNMSRATRGPKGRNHPSPPAPLPEVDGCPFGLDSKTATLFPSEFQDSPMGPIPKGWAMRPLPEVIDVNPRRTLKSGAVAPYLDMKNVPMRGHCAEDVIDREFNSGTKFQNGDTLLARITPCLENGKTAFVDFLNDNQVGWGSTEFIVFAPKPPLPPQFAYFLARSDELRSHAIQNMTGTSGRQRVPSECFTKFQLAIPSRAVARTFDELTSPLMAMIKAASQESCTLATVRGTLLPKLLSGEPSAYQNLSRV